MFRKSKQGRSGRPGTHKWKVCQHAHVANIKGANLVVSETLMRRLIKYLHLRQWAPSYNRGGARIAFIDYMHARYANITSICTNYVAYTTSYTYIVDIFCTLHMCAGLLSGRLSTTMASWGTKTRLAPPVCSFQAAHGSTAYRPKTAAKVHGWSPLPCRCKFY